MDTMSAYLNSVASQGKPQRVFDWNKAARILRDRGARRATAGLALDMEWTAGEILTDGEPNTESDTYLSSNWATPVLVIDGEEIECWAFARDTGWDANTKWPESAIKILRGEEK